jgi:hypothetical protein
VEICPRALTGPVRKSSWRERHKSLFERFSRQAEPLTGTSDPDYRIEGKIFRPHPVGSPG